MMLPRKKFSSLVCYGNILSQKPCCFDDGVSSIVKDNWFRLVTLRQLFFILWLERIKNEIVIIFVPLFLKLNNCTNFLVAMDKVDLHAPRPCRKPDTWAIRRSVSSRLSLIRLGVGFALNLFSEARLTPGGSDSE